MDNDGLSLICNLFNIIGFILILRYSIGKCKICSFRPIIFGCLLIVFGMVGFSRVLLKTNEPYLILTFFMTISMIIIGVGISIIVNKKYLLIIEN